MGKTLIIVRHGKSSWNNTQLRDYDRPLNQRGLTDAKKVGEFILAKEGRPSLILSSSAKRACDTARIIANQMNSIDLLIKEEKLYLAWIDELFNSIYKISDDVDKVILVGHNPGLTELINNLGVQLDNLPTASAACFHFDTKSWKRINADNAELTWFQLARNL